MNKILTFFFLYFLGTSAISMSNDQQIVSAPSTAISYKEAANAAFRGVICYGGKELVLYSLTIAGATAPVMVVVALGMGATYVAGFGYDRALAYASSASLESTESVDEIIDDFALMNGETDEDEDLLDDFCVVKSTPPSLITTASKTAVGACIAACNSISATVQNMPNTIANAISNAPYTICSGAVGAMVSAVIPFSFCAAAGSALASNMSAQVLHIVFDEEDSAEEAKRWLEEMQNAPPPVCTIFEQKLVIIDEYNPNNGTI